MSKADKMFEELGYIKFENTNFIRYRQKEKIGIFEIGIVEIVFWKKYKYVNRNLNDVDLTWIDMQELQAINEKCKELGWLDE